jgi:hypothetical protein
MAAPAATPAGLVAVVHWIAGLEARFASVR